MATTKTKKNPESLPEKAMRKFIDLAVRRLVLTAAYGRGDAVVTQFELDGDGRTAKKYARILCEQGYIKPRSDKSYDRSPCYTVVNPGPWSNDINVEEPDLIGLVKNHEYRYNSLRRGGSDADAYGVSLASEHGSGDLTSDQLAYILFNPEKFKFVHYRYGKAESHEWGTCDDDHFRSSLLVSSDAYDDFVYELQLGERIKALYNQNIGWGLQELCGVSEDDASFMESSSSSGVFVPSRRSGEGEELNWGETMRNRLQSSENALAYHTRRMEGLQRVQVAVAKYGGWEKFQTDYRARIEEHLRSEDAKDESA